MARVVKRRFESNTATHNRWREYASRLPSPAGLRPTRWAVITQKTRPPSLSGTFFKAGPEFSAGLCSKALDFCPLQRRYPETGPNSAFRPGNFTPNISKFSPAIKKTLSTRPWRGACGYRRNFPRYRHGPGNSVQQGYPATSNAHDQAKFSSMNCIS